MYYKIFIYRSDAKWIQRDVKKLRNILSKEEFNILFDKIFDEAKKRFKNSNDEQLKKYSRS